MMLTLAARVLSGAARDWGLPYLLLASRKGRKQPQLVVLLAVSSKDGKTRAQFPSEVDWQRSGMIAGTVLNAQDLLNCIRGMH